MASESTEEGSMTVSLEPELAEWLDSQAAALGVDRETALLRLIATSRAADLDGVVDSDELVAVLADAEPIQAAVETAAGDIADDRIAGTVERAVSTQVKRAVSAEVEQAVAEQFEQALTEQIEQAVDDRVEDRVDQAVADRVQSFESDFQRKIEDVRERVIQVKQEADSKAPADHGHEELDRVDAIGGRLADLEAAVSDLEASVDDVAEDVEDVREAGETGRDDLTETVDALQDRLKTVAWVVSDLREAHESTDGSAALEELKRAAVVADASRAVCERCGEGVEIGLLTEPRCPHCEATVTNVAPAEGFFGKPTLLVASQLESGEQ